MPRPASPPQGPEDEATYRHRWETLQGKYAAESRRSNELIGQLQREVAALKEQIARQAEQQQGAAKPANVETAIDELQREYGEAFTNALDQRIQRVAQAHVERSVAERVKPVEEKVARVESDNAAKASGDYFTQLSRICPDWEQMNVDKGFLAWLGATRVGRRSMQELLNDAHQAGDAVGVADIFNTYGRVAKQTQTQKPAARPDARELIAPRGRGSGDGAVIDDSQGKVITMAEVDKFYHDMELGRVKPEEAARREAEIMQAVQEGRVVG